MLRCTLIIVFVLACAYSLPLPAAIGQVPSELKCDFCTRAFTALSPLVRANKSVDVVVAAAIPICEHIKGAGNCKGAGPCKDLCIGMVHEFAQEVITLYGRNGKVGAHALCEVLGACAPAPAPGAFDPVEVPGPGLLIRSNLTDYTGEKAWVQWSRTNGTGKFMHITDTHLDLQYVEGTNSECDEPLCCRARYGPPPKGKRAAGKYGDYACDTSPLLAESMWKEMKKNFADEIDFAILTGDEPPHDIWMQSKEGNVGAINAVSAGLVGAFSNVPTFPILGNHAAFPVNQFLGPKQDNWLYEAIANDWAHWLPDDAVRTLRFGGYYVARIRPGLRVIALHTTPMTGDDLWLQLNTTAHDFTGQLAWFNDTLQQLRALGESAYIIGHCRPSGFIEPIRTAFYQLAYKNRDIIKGYLFGHSHPADFGVMRMTDELPPFAVEYTAGSVTPFSNLNPGFRVWEYARDSFDLQGWDAYWVDLEEANKGLAEPQWQLRYHAPDYFNMTDISPSSWVDFAYKLTKSEDLNSKINTARFKGGPSSPDSAVSNACGILEMHMCPFTIQEI